MKKNEAAAVGNVTGAFIHKKTVQAVIDTGFVEEMYLEAAAECLLGEGEEELRLKKSWAFGVADIEQFLAKDWNKDIRIHYGEGYGPNLFAQECRMADGNETEEPMYVIVPQSVWEKRDLHSGDLLVIKRRNENRACFVFAAGFYSGESCDMVADSLLVPLSCLEYLEEDGLEYTRAKFTLDTERNREIADFRSEAKAAVLLLFQRRREAAVLRVLGVSAVPVGLVLAAELAILNFAGSALGLCLIFAVTKTGSLYAMGTAVAAYLVGALAGAVGGCMLVTRAQPLELLQVKE